MQCNTPAGVGCNALGQPRRRSPAYVYPEICFWIYSWKFLDFFLKFVGVLNDIGWISSWNFVGFFVTFFGSGAMPLDSLVDVPLRMFTRKSREWSIYATQCRCSPTFKTTFYHCVVLKYCSEKCPSRVFGSKILQFWACSLKHLTKGSPPDQNFGTFSIVF